MTGRLDEGHFESPPVVNDSGATTQLGLGKLLALLFLLPVIITIPLENVIVLDGFGTINRVLGLIAAPALVLLLLCLGRIPKPALLFASLASFVLIYGTLSVFWSSDFDGAITRAFSHFQVCVLAFLIIAFGLLYGAREISLGYICGAFLAAVWVIYDTQQYVALRRMEIEGFNPNWMSYAIAMSGICSYCLLRRNSYAEKCVVLSSWITVGLAIFLLGSRGGFLFYGMVTLAIISRLTWLESLFTVLLAMCLIIAFPLFIDTDLGLLFLRFFETSDLVGDGDFSGRGVVWSRGLELLGNPVFGSGLESFSAAVGKSSHNVFLALFFELGVVGLTMYLVLWMLIPVAAYKRGRFGLGLCLALASLLVPASLANWEFHKAFWFGYAILFIHIFKGNTSSALRSHLHHGVAVFQYPSGVSSTRVEAPSEGHFRS